MRSQQDITISDGRSFLISSYGGNISAGTHQGYYDFDTRFISSLQLRVGGKKIIALTSKQIDNYSAIHFLTNSSINNIKEASLGIYRARFVGNGFHEDIKITNFTNQDVSFPVTIKFETDFADIFSVRSMDPKKRGKTVCAVDKKNNFILYDYSYLENRIGIKISTNKKPEILDKDKFTFRVNLKPHEEWSACLTCRLVHNNHELALKYDCGSFGLRTEKSSKAFKEWHQSLAEIKTDNGFINKLINQSISDLSALHLDVWDGIIPGAGIPWYLAIFGRDSIIASLQTLILSPLYAKSVLKYLSLFQGREVEEIKDEEPGKIIHEVRSEETAAFLKEPFASYYGTIDATLLYLILASQYFHFTNDRNFLLEIKENIYKVIAWLYEYGDIDSDTFIEYKSNQHGLRNKGWKDSYNAINFKNGKLAKAPVALVEVQGYLYRALKEIAPIVKEIYKDLKLSLELEKKAQDLKIKFNEVFWLKNLQYYAMALDKDKNLVDSLTSNVGHTLWSGIAYDNYADIIVKKLMDNSMYSGWGIRTLSSDSSLYNPISYHNGSIWPFDNSLIINGFVKYGFYNEAMKVSEDLIEASKYFLLNRLPELFVGLSKKDYPFPIEYPVSNTPQAWSSGALFLIIQSLIGLEVNAIEKKVYLFKRLPTWINNLEIENLHIGNGILNFTLLRVGEGYDFKVNKNTSGYKVKVLENT